MPVDVVQRFRDIWREGFSEADLVAFLRQYGPLAPDVRQTILLFDQEQRWRSGQALAVEDYVRVCPELSESPDTCLLLIQGEFDASGRAGRPVTSPELRGRFPHLAKKIQELLSGLAKTQAAADAQEFHSYFSQATPSAERRLGRYHLLELVGEGAFGQVWLGFDEMLQRKVAVKIVHPERQQTDAEMEALINEARTLAVLNHPNIVPVYDAGRVDDQVYVTSLFVDGQNLAELLRNRSFSFREAAEIVAVIGHALHHAHERQLVHRDVKPSNVLIESATQRVYLTDFGLASRGQTFSPGGLIAGTPGYMSPEQARGENHRVDHRTDIFALGAVLYELLTGRPAFRGETLNKVLEQIQSAQPEYPRATNPEIPAPLESICLRAMAKRAADRYASAELMAADLEFWLKGREDGQFDDHSSTVRPQGLRSYNASDAGFFLQMLPGLRTPEGLPESLAFWKSRIEDRSESQTFTVGLIYGPSGCGKSSLVKAGLLPHLSDEIIKVYVEAAADGTERRILNSLTSQGLVPAGTTPDIHDTFASLRDPEHSPVPNGRRVLIVIDQFEQWLHAHRSDSQPELVAALRHCDGQRLICVVIVRDDFWLSISRFMDQLEVELQPCVNIQLVDLFDLRHSRRILELIGHAYERLPEPTEHLGDDQIAFLDEAVNGLSEDGRIVPVRLALLAEMLKSKPWTSQTLRDVGGVEGIGVTFLEETFSSRRANPRHRKHEKSAQAVLASMLPQPGSDIKGHMQSQQQLHEICCYRNRPTEFAELLKILDGELRLITPTDPEGEAASTSLSTSPSALRFYQLTHDYLVPSLREWLTSKQKETRRGRAQLKLEERTALWKAYQQNRYLPSLSEWLRISTLTDKRAWSEPQRKMMAKARQVIALYAVGATAILAALSCVFLMTAAAIEQRQKAGYSKALVESLSSANTSDIESLLVQVKEHHDWTFPILREIVQDPSSTPRATLHARLALVATDTSHIAHLIKHLLHSNPTDVPVLLQCLEPHKEAVCGTLVNTLHVGSNAECIRATSALAHFDWLESELDPPAIREKIVAALLDAVTSESHEWIRLLAPIATEVLPSLKTRFHDESERDVIVREALSSVLAFFLSNDSKALAQLMLAAQGAHDTRPLIHFAKRNPTEAVDELRTVLNQQPEGKTRESLRLWSRQAKAAVCLLLLGDSGTVWPLLKHRNNPSRRSYLIDKLSHFTELIETLSNRLDEENDAEIRYALAVVLCEVKTDILSINLRHKLVSQFRRVYRNDPDPGVHSAVRLALNRWGESHELKAADVPRFSADRGTRGWAVNSTGESFSVLNGPTSFIRPAILALNKPKTRISLPYDFAVATTEVTVAQFKAFKPKHQHYENYAPDFDCPVNVVSWYDAVAYCNWMNAQEKIPMEEWCYLPNERGKYAEGMQVMADVESRTGYRLPTTDEFILLCWGDTQGIHPHGDQSDLLHKYEWFSENSRMRTSVVGARVPNMYGLFDMLGNVAEWNHNPLLSSIPNEESESEIRSRAISGGRFHFGSHQLTINCFHSPAATQSDTSTGFRLARTLRTPNAEAATASADKRIVKVASASGWSGSISPNGDRLLYSVSKQDITQTKHTLNVLDLSSGVVKDLAIAGKDHSWSPDGLSIALCEGHDRSTRVCVVSSNDNRRTLIGRGYMPAWSKDGSRLFLFDPADSSMQSVKMTSESPLREVIFSGVIDTFAQVSPDGTKLAMVDSDEMLVIVDIKTGRQICSYSVADMHPVMKAWNPQSTHVTFGGFASLGIWVMNSATGKAVRLIDGGYVNPRWSANGEFLSVDNRAQNLVEVYDISEVQLP